MEKLKYISKIRLDKMNNKFRLVALKIIVAQNQFTQKYFYCVTIKYECLSKPASEGEVA